jgi:hypothetical protein
LYNRDNGGIRSPNLDGSDLSSASIDTGKLRGCSMIACHSLISRTLERISRFQIKSFEFLRRRAELA